MPLRRRLAVATQQGAHLGLTEPTVPAGSTDTRDPPRGRPAGDSLRVNPEQSRNLSRREQTLVIAVYVQSPPTVSLVPQVSDPSSLALNEYFLPRFLEIGRRFADTVTSR